MRTCYSWHASLSVEMAKLYVLLQQLRSPQHVSPRGLQRQERVWRWRGQQPRLVLPASDAAQSRPPVRCRSRRQLVGRVRRGWHRSNLGLRELLYQLEITSGGSPSPNKYIVQAVNTGSDVSSGQFDILVGAGGFGIYDACSSDCQYGQVCSGGHCNSPYYSGNFAAWTPDGNCYGGGVHNPSGCSKLVTSSSHTFADDTLLYGCPEAIKRGFHANFDVQWQKVQCPPSLYKVTGLRRKDDGEHPAPKLGLTLSNSGRTTTTMDCCKSTCAWRQNIASFTDPQFPQVYTCNKIGTTN